MKHTSRSIVLHAPNDLRLEVVELLPARHDEAVVDVAFGGVCGSDLHYWKSGRVGESVLREPMILGHEIVGRVSVAAPDGSGPSVGTAVAVHPATVCGACQYCVTARRHLCERLRYMGSAARLPHTPGGFSERILVQSERLIPIPSQLDMTVAALAEPAAVAWHAVDRIAAVGVELASRRVLVIGAGPIGLLAMTALRRAGAGEIIASDLHRRPLEVAERVGASGGIPAVMVEDALRGEPVDIVVESSGSTAGLDTALRVVKPGGLIVCLGQLPDQRVTAPFHLAVTREIALTGSSRFFTELPAVLEAMADGSLTIRPIISHVYPLDDAEAAFLVAADAGASSKVLIRIGA